MSTPISDLRIDSLHRAFLTAFEWSINRNCEELVTDLATPWVELVASALQDVRLTATPAVDAYSSPLRFVANHWIRTELFKVARGGMKGGP